MLCHVEAWFVVFAKYWVIVMHVVAKLMCFFMPGSVEWLNDTMAEIVFVMLIMVLMTKFSW